MHIRRLGSVLLLHGKCPVHMGLAATVLLLCAAFAVGLPKGSTSGQRFCLRSLQMGKLEMELAFDVEPDAASHAQNVPSIGVDEGGLCAPGYSTASPKYAASDIIVSMATTVVRVRAMAQVWALWMHGPHANGVRCFVSLHVSESVHMQEVEGLLAHHNLSCSVRFLRYKYEHRALWSMAQLLDYNSSWYIFADDDTFFFMDNLLRTLSSLDASASVFYGSISEDAKQVEKHGRFAYGGAGVIFGQSAFLKTAWSVPSCFHKYGDLFGWDEMISRCAFDQNITFSRLDHLHQLDLESDVTGLFESGYIDRNVVSIHHFGSYYDLFPGAEVNAVDAITHISRALSLLPPALRFQRVAWVSPHSNHTVLLTLGYSLTEYSNHVSRERLQCSEATWKPAAFMGCTRPRDHAKQSWFIQSAAEFAGGYTLIYISRSAGNVQVTLQLHQS